MQAHAHSWYRVAQAMRHSRHVVAIDLRGHVDSQWLPGGAYHSPYHFARHRPSDGYLRKGTHHVPRSINEIGLSWIACGKSVTARDEAQPQSICRASPRRARLLPVHRPTATIAGAPVKLTLLPAFLKGI